MTLVIFILYNLIALPLAIYAGYKYGLKRFVDEVAVTVEEATKKITEQRMASLEKSYNDKLARLDEISNKLEHCLDKKV